MRRPLALAALLTLGAALATQYPLTVTDDLGRRVTLAREPLRIVSMLPSHTETLAALGLADHLIAVDSYSNYPPDVVARLPKVGSAYHPSIEAIVALKPDLVLADESSGSRLTEKLAQAGLTVYGGSAQDFAEVFEKMEVIGRLVNREASATRLITQVRRDLNDVQATLRGATPVPVYYEVDPTPYTAGPDSFIGALLQKAGGRNIIPANLGAFPKISPELVLRERPTVLIGLTRADALTRPGWATMPAVQAGRVFKPTPEENDALSRPGPRLALALRALARYLHPERFR